MKTIINYLLLLSISLGTLMAQESTSVEVVVTDVSNDKGMLYVGLYDSESEFLKKRFKSAMTTIKNGQATITFENVPAGTYAISLFHDENSNQELDMNFLGIPKEDIGCSNNAKGFMGPPKWKDARFKVTNTPVSMEINM